MDGLGLFLFQKLFIDYLFMYNMSIFGFMFLMVYFGLFEVGEMKEGDVVLVFGVVGVIGLVVGQIVKNKGVK